LNPSGDDGRKRGGISDESCDVTEPERPVQGMVQTLRRSLSVALRAVWRRMPFPPGSKDRVAGFVFRNLPFLVSWSATYRNWKAEADRLREHIEKLRNSMVIERERPDYTELSALPRPTQLLARAIAFYLPQFHPIEENDRWWGQGFTEWTNVLRSQPQFEGHQQPRIPGELGYYDLVQMPDVRRRQAELAYQYGLSGFCFYFYWFAGKRLLETPIEAYASDDQIDFPFCLCWANENWSRRWDGRDDQVLIAQAHSEADDLAFIEYLSRYLKNSKYIRIDGRPLVLVYRPSLLPDSKATTLRWRKWCRDNNLGEIHLAYTQSFDSADPAEYGFDSAIEFPPNNMGLEPKDDLVAPITDKFDCRIYDWGTLLKRSEQYSDPGYILHRGVSPQWDNTPRRMNSGTVLLGSSPEVYQSLLKRAALAAVQRTRKPDERLVFINAWNEWAEGAYLEPDVDRGYAWLAATRRALLPEDDEMLVEPADFVPLEISEQAASVRKIIVMVHDLHKNGAQYLSLNFAALLNSDFHCEVTVITSGEGCLGANFRSYAKIVELSEKRHSRDQILETLCQLESDGFDSAIVNSSASGWIAPFMHEAGIRMVGLVHEMPAIAKKMNLQAGMKALDAYASTTIFATEMVRDLTARDVLGHAWRNAHILPQGLYKRQGIRTAEDKKRAHSRLCAELQVTTDAKFILGVGFGDRRKGIDIFCENAVAATRLDQNNHFVWVGDIDDEMSRICLRTLHKAPDVSGRIHLVGFKNDTSTYYMAASAYFLSSREDPYPSTVLEALASGTPSIVIAGTTGIEDLAGTGAVRVVPDKGPESFAVALRDFLADDVIVQQAADAGVNLVRSKFGFTSFVGDVLRLLNVPVPKVSVIVPNFNYERYLPHRLASILNQTVPVWEIIFLDDASTDKSLEVVQKYLHNCPIRYRIVRNEQNSGSVFAQWKKGVDMAEGDVIWIAEADDWAAASFVEIASQAFEDEEVVLSYTQSNQVDERSRILCPHYLDYVSDIGADRWRRPFVNDGVTELAQGLSVKNTLPNVSGVLFRREPLKRVLDEHFDEVRSYRVAGDWCVYAYLALEGRIAFDPRSLNYHRRHQNSVTISRFTRQEWDEIQRMQQKVAGMVAVPADIQKTASDYLASLAERLSADVD
jgi:O-antigen biosynthesis protein